MATVTVKLNGTALPGGLTSLKRSDELLWSEGTGRSASNGKMTGSVVARKQTYSLGWGVITSESYAAIRSAANSSAFMELSAVVGGSSVASCTVYRGNISGDLLETIDGTAYWKNVTLELVEV